MSDIEDGKLNDSAVDSEYFPGWSPKVVFALLFFLLVVPSAYFVLKSFEQLNVILDSVGTEIELSISDPASLEGMSEELDVLYRLESDVMALRHQRSTAFISTRTWMRFMSLIFGTILITIGAGYALGKVSGPSFSGEGTLSEFKLAIATSSPGLVLAFFGTLLVLIPNLSNQSIETNDTATYLHAGFILSAQPFSEEERAAALESINQIISNQDTTQ